MKHNDNPTSYVYTKLVTSKELSVYVICDSVLLKFKALPSTNKTYLNNLSVLSLLTFYLLFTYINT